jgi:hypothetical protein
MSKTKSKSKTSKTKKSDSKTTKAADKPGGRGMMAKITSKSKKEGGAGPAKAKKGVISGRTRIGEVPDALMIYKGR